MRFGWMVSLILLVIFLFGCQGEQGPAGVSGEYVDHVSPEIEISSPTPDSILVTDEITFNLDVTDSLGEIEYITMYVNGSNRIGDDSLVSYFPPYQIFVDFVALDMPYGMFNVTAKAVDTSGNSQTTPLMFYTRKNLVGLDTLSYFNFASIYAAGFQLPYCEIDSASGDTMLAANYTGVRFQVPYRCELVAVELFFSDPGSFPDMSGSTITGPSNFQVSMFHPDDQGLPGVGIDSMVYAASNVMIEDWTYADLSSFDDGNPYQADELEEVILLVRSTEVWQEDMTRALIFTTKVDSNYTGAIDEYTHRSLDNETGIEGRGWGTMLNHAPEYFEIVGEVDKQDWMIRLIIDYGDGEEVALYPDGLQEVVKRGQNRAVSNTMKKKLMR